MRDESLIFRDLSTLCTSRGYVHALAYLCFRDSVIMYADEIHVEDVKHLFSPERLIRTEISTLIGLLVQQEIDWSLPESGTVQQYIEETEKLLQELHQSMSAPAIDELRASIESGGKTNPFQKGLHLREPIFYSGESAYSFQFRDLSVPSTKPIIRGLKRTKASRLRLHATLCIPSPGIRTTNSLMPLTTLRSAARRSGRSYPAFSSQPKRSQMLSESNPISSKEL